MNIDSPTEVVQETESVEPFITHLYPLPGEGNTHVTFCGIRVEDDPHAQMHKGYGQKSPKWTFPKGPGDQCPSCGAPVCATCLRRI